MYRNIVLPIMPGIENFVAYFKLEEIERRIKEDNDRLLANGVDHNLLTAPSGASPLAHAAFKGDLNRLKLLLDKGANINITSKKGFTALHAAAAEGHKDIANELIKEGITIDEMDEDGCTPLHFAATSGHTDIVELLLIGKADANTTDKNGFSSLDKAAGCGRKNTVEFILNWGVNPTKNASYYAAENGHAEIVKLINDKMEERKISSGLAVNKSTLFGSNVISQEKRDRDPNESPTSSASLCPTSYQ